MQIEANRSEVGATSPPAAANFSLAIPPKLSNTAKLFDIV
jgi:hypothetical protein